MYVTLQTYYDFLLCSKWLVHIYTSRWGGYRRVPHSHHTHETRPTFTSHTKLRLVGSFKWYVSFAEYRLFCRALLQVLQQRHIILRSLLIVATPCLYTWLVHTYHIDGMFLSIHMCETCTRVSLFAGLVYSFHDCFIRSYMYVASAYVCIPVYVAHVFVAWLFHTYTYACDFFTCIPVYVTDLFVAWLFHTYTYVCRFCSCIPVYVTFPFVAWPFHLYTYVCDVCTCIPVYVTDPFVAWLVHMYTYVCDVCTCIPVYVTDPFVAW